MSKAENNLTIEETFAQLEDLMTQLEREELPMEESFSLYAKGLGMIKACREKIDEVEQKIQIIEESGEIHEF